MSRELERKTPDQRRRCWLVIQCWFGVLVTTLSGNRPLESAEEDVRRACELLLPPPAVEPVETQ